MTFAVELPAISGAPHCDNDLLLRGAHLEHERQVDVLLRHGVVHEVAAAGELIAAPGTPQLDLDGYLLLPGLADPHAHLDHALTWETLETGYVDLPGAIDAWGRATLHLDVEQMQQRVLRALDEQLAHGVTAVRTHSVPCMGEHPLAAVQTWSAIREAVGSAMQLQVVFMCRPDTPSDLVRAAVDSGADLVGGVPYMTEDPAAENERLLALADELSVGVDLHVDEDLDPKAVSLADLARRVSIRGPRHGVTASHCVSLGVQDPASVAETVRLVAESGIGVVTLPLTNLYLMGRDIPSNPPRGLTALRSLLNADVPLAAGGDNLRDPFNPVGRADPLAIASLLVSTGRLTITEAYRAVSTTARAVMGLPPAGVEPGLAADLLAIRAHCLDDAVARSPEDRIVLRQGQVVAATVTVRQTALAAL